MLGSIKLRYTVEKLKMEPTARLEVLQRNRVLNKICLDLVSELNVETLFFKVTTCSATQKTGQGQ